jgi:hypothetical protein
MIEKEDKNAQSWLKNNNQEYLHSVQYNYCDCIDTYATADYESTLSDLEYSIVHKPST